MSLHKLTMIGFGRVDSRAVIVLFCFVWGCTSTEKTVAPLGFGPLAQAEEAAQARSLNQLAVLDAKKRGRRQPPSDVPSKINWRISSRNRYDGQGFRHGFGHACAGNWHNTSASYAIQIRGLAWPVARQRHDPLPNPEFPGATHGRS